MQVPNDVSVVGFDDIKMAPYSNPPLTTVRQPLLKMGEIAARSVLNQIKNSEEFVAEILIEPEFVVRKSTAKVSMQLSPCREGLPSAGVASATEANRIRGEPRRNVYSQLECSASHRDPCPFLQIKRPWRW